MAHSANKKKAAMLAMLAISSCFIYWFLSLIILIYNITAQRIMTQMYLKS